MDRASLKWFQEHYIITTLVLLLFGLLLSLIPDSTYITTLSATLIATAIAFLILSFGVRGIETKIIEELPSLLDASHSKIELEEFHKNREKLPSWSSEKFIQSSEIWFACYTCAYKHPDLLRLSRQGKNIRLILTNPNSNAMDFIEKVDPEHSKETMKHSINDLTRAAQSSGIEVKWFDGIIFSSTIIGNPNSENCWAQVEFFVPYESADKRAAVIVSKEKGEDFLHTILDAYKKIWDKSEEPELNS